MSQEHDTFNAINDADCDKQHSCRRSRYEFSEDD